MGWFLQVDWMGIVSVGSHTANPKSVKTRSSLWNGYTWKINWAQFDSEKNQPSTWRSPQSFQMLRTGPVRNSEGRCINTLYWLDQDPWQLFVDIPSGGCSNSFTKNRTWHVINLNSLSVDKLPFLLNHILPFRRRWMQTWRVLKLRLLHKLSHMVQIFQQENCQAIKIAPAFLMV